MRYNGILNIASELGHDEQEELFYALQRRSIPEVDLQFINEVAINHTSGMGVTTDEVDGLLEEIINLRMQVGYLCLAYRLCMSDHSFGEMLRFEMFEAVGKSGLIAMPEESNETN